MLTVESSVTVRGLTGREVTDFLLDPDDDRYRAWWPGTHLELHPTRRGSRDDHVGDLLVMNEYVGSRRLLDRHVHTEFALLRDLLRRERIDAAPAPTSVHSERDEDGP